MPEWVQHLDDTVLEWFGGHRTKFWDYNFKSITALGTTTVVALVTGFTVGLLVCKARFKTALLAVILIIGAYEATRGVKKLVDRPRPPKAGKPTASFPSSHTSLAMAGYLILALCWRKPAPPGVRPRVRLYGVVWALVLGGLVGTSRLYFGKHYLSDVLGGLLLGWVAGAVFYCLDRFTERTAVAASPRAP
jgi:undecaprenyl-diphosphatase